MEQTVQRRVRIIPAKRDTDTPQPGKKKHQRVAAYCRVSTDSEEQITSYEAQKAYYTQKIEENPDWELAGIFADKGLSGTSMKKRENFNKMIAACKQDRHLPDQIPLPLRPEHGGLPGNSADAESPRHRRHL